MARDKFPRIFPWKFTEGFLKYIDIEDTFLDGDDSLLFKDIADGLAFKDSIDIEDTTTFTEGGI